MKTNRPKPADVAILVSLLIVSMAVMNPAASFAGFLLTALIAMNPIRRGPRGNRIFGVVVLLLALSGAAVQYPAARAHLDSYRSRAKKAEAASLDFGGRTMPAKTYRPSRAGDAYGFLTPADPGNCPVFSG